MGTQVPLKNFSWCNDSIKFDLDAFCGVTEGKKRRIGVEKFSKILEFFAKLLEFFAKLLEFFCTIT